jgi:hypothetical protein
MGITRAASNMNLKISFFSNPNFCLLNRNTRCKSRVAIPNLKNASASGDISPTVNFAAIGVNAVVKVKKITMDNYFIQ